MVSPELLSMVSPELRMVSPELPELGELSMVSPELRGVKYGVPRTVVSPELGRT